MQPQMSVRVVTVASPSCRPGASCGESAELLFATFIAEKNSPDSPHDAPGRQLGEATVTSLTFQSDSSHLEMRKL